jgi:hypothetical protein
MAVTYTRQQRQAAKREGQTLATIAVGGIEFSGPIPADEARRLRVYLREMLERLHPEPSSPSGATTDAGSDG